MPWHPAPPIQGACGVSALFRPTHRQTPTLPCRETNTFLAACRACLSATIHSASPHPPSPTQSCDQRNSPHPTYKVMRRDCPGLRVGPAHVVAHRYSLPNTTPAPLTHMCVVKEGCGLMSIYYVCCPKLPVYNDTTTKKRASSERFTQSLFKKRS